MAQCSSPPVFTHFCHPLLHWIRLSLWPKEYGKSDGVWPLRLGHKMYSSLPWSLGSFILGETSTNWPATWASHLGNRNSNPNPAFRWCRVTRYQARNALPGHSQILDILCDKCDTILTRETWEEVCWEASGKEGFWKLKKPKRKVISSGFSAVGCEHVRFGAAAAVLRSWGPFLTKDANCMASRAGRWKSLVLDEGFSHRMDQPQDSWHL